MRPRWVFSQENTTENETYWDETAAGGRVGSRRVASPFFYSVNLSSLAPAGQVLGGFSVVAAPAQRLEIVLVEHGAAVGDWHDVINQVSGCHPSLRCAPAA